MPAPSIGAGAGSIAGLDRPGGASALLHAEASRGGGAGLLVGHHRHAVVSVERLDEAPTGFSTLKRGRIPGLAFGITVPGRRSFLYPVPFVVPNSFLGAASDGPLSR